MQRTHTPRKDTHERTFHFTPFTEQGNVLELSVRVFCVDTTKPWAGSPADLPTYASVAALSFSNNHLSVPPERERLTHREWGGEAASCGVL